MTIYRLTVFEPAGQLVNYFTSRLDAKITFQTTYSKVVEKPRFTITPIEVLERDTHL